MALPAPSVAEFDRVFASMRKVSQTEYVQWRDWLLSLGAGGGPIAPVINISYADLQILLLGGTAVPGQFYNITDFQTVQDIPNTVDTATGPNEELIVQAITTDAIGPFAYSVDNPRDLIMYDIDDTSFGALFGRITFRHVLAQNCSGYFDVRFQTYRRWETLPASGIFTVTLDNGNAFQDFDAFSNIGTIQGAIDCHMAPVITFGFPQQVNNVLGQFNVDINLEAGVSETTLLNNCENIRIGGDSIQNVFLGTNQGVNIGDNCVANEIGAGARNGEIGDQSNLSVIGANVDSFTIGRRNISTTIGDDSENIMVGDSVINSDIGPNNVNIQIGPNCNGADIATDCDNIRIGSFCTIINIAQNCRYVVIDNGCDTIDINENCERILFHQDVNDRLVEANNSDREDYPFRTIYEFQVDYSDPTFGNIGTVTLDFIQLNGYVVFSTVQATTPLVGVGANISVGIAVDDPLGIVNAIGVGAPTFAGPPMNGANLWLDTTYTTPATATRAIEHQVAGANITAGVVTYKVWVEYPKL